MPINKELFAKVRDKILRVPEAYDQDEFGEKAPTPCGTRACIAGHALIEAGFCTAAELHNRQKINPVTGRPERIDALKRATSLLGLTDSEGDALLGSGEAENWKAPYGHDFRYAMTDAERAQVAAAYIDHIIETGKVN